MLDTTAEYCEAEVMADCVIGTLLLPDKQDVRLDTFSLTYYLDRNRLLLIDREEHLPALISMGKQVFITFWCSFQSTVVLKSIRFFSRYRHMV